MSGHSKWSTIKHKKGALDSKRSKMFSKLDKTVEVVPPISVQVVPGISVQVVPLYGWI